MPATRDDIIDAAVAALEASTGVVTVTRNLENVWTWDASKFPVATVMERGTDIVSLAYPTTSTGSEDMQATMRLLVRGYVWDKANQVADKRTSLISDIETALVSASTLGGLAAVYPVSVTIDDGVIENYGVSDSEFRVMYFYHHAKP